MNDLQKGLVTGSGVGQVIKKIEQNKESKGSNDIHFCKKHNCPYWDNCPICGYEDMGINPSMREVK